MKRDLLSIGDLKAGEIEELLDNALQMKKSLKRGISEPLLEAKTLVMIFEKPSLRTRVTFEVAMKQLGGHAINLSSEEIQLGKRESVADVAANLQRWVDGIMARTFSHEKVLELAQNSSIPVINGLTDLEHPCQALAMALTLLEKKSSLKGLKVVFVGDGNNVAHSIMLLCPKVGMDFAISTPKGYGPNPEVVKKARKLAQKYGTSLQSFHDPFEAVEGADLIYTDVWTSMGHESEAQVRREVFHSYQINSQVLGLAKKDCLVSHCLPAHRGEEITDELLDGPRCIAFDEAENRLHIQKSILTALMK